LRDGVRRNNLPVKVMHISELLNNNQVSSDKKSNKS
jgi:hypothetical protein